MTTFDNRKNAFENKYAHDADMQFKVVVRRNKMVGLWAAGLMGITGEDAVEYAKAVVKSDFEEAGHEDVVRKISGDIKGAASDDAIRAKLEELLPEAQHQIMNETDA